MVMRVLFKHKLFGNIYYISKSSSLSDDEDNGNDRESIDNEEMMKLIPLKRMGTPEDIADAVKFLTVDSTYVTGQVLEVDGGLII